MELFRTTDNTGNAYQWCDTELCMVLDRVTGKPQDIMDNGVFCTPVEAEAFVSGEYKKGWEHRLVIVRMNTISAYLIKGREQ